MPVWKILGRQANARLISSAPQLLAVAKPAHVHLKGQEYLQACAIIAEVKGD
jgi:hypothetical protein